MRSPFLRAEFRFRVMKDTIVVRGARQHNLKGFDLEIPAARLHGRSPAVGLGQVLARVRHDLRRGPAALRRVAVGVRAAVPRADGEARRRLDRRALARGRDRAEESDQDVALDRRHGDRDLRLPAAALGARRTHVLSALRPRDAAGHRAVRRPTRCSRCRRARASTSPSRCGSPTRSRTRSSSRTCARRDSSASRSTARSRTSTSSLSAAVDVTSRQGAARRRRPARRERRTRAAVSPTRSAPRSAKATATASSCSPMPIAARARRATPSTTLRFTERFECPNDGTRAPAPTPQLFSFNNPRGACERCNGFGATLEYDEALIVPYPTRIAARRRDRSVDEAALRQQAPRARRVREARRHLDGHAVARSCPPRARQKLLHARTQGLQGHLPLPRRSRGEDATSSTSASSCGSTRRRRSARRVTAPSSSPRRCRCASAGATSPRSASCRSTGCSTWLDALELTRLRAAGRRAHPARKRATACSSCATSGSTTSR